MLLSTEARPNGGQGVLFVIPSFVQEQYHVYFNGSAYSPFDASDVTKVTSQLLDFAAERFLYDGYHPFVLDILAGYPEFKLDAFDPLDSALLTAYSKGFYHQSFAKLLVVIRDREQVNLNYNDTRILSLLETTYQWSIDHATQFKDDIRFLLTRRMQTSPAAPSFAFISTCAELDLPLEQWVAREPTAFRNLFGSSFPVAGSGLSSLAEVVRGDVAKLTRAATAPNSTSSTSTSPNSATVTILPPTDPSPQPISKPKPTIPPTTTTGKPKPKPAPEGEPKPLAPAANANTSPKAEPEPEAQEETFTIPTLAPTTNRISYCHIPEPEWL